MVFKTMNSTDHYIFQIDPNYMDPIQMDPKNLDMPCIPGQQVLTPDQLNIEILVA